MLGFFPLGVSPYGCHDLAGNVWEWTRSESADYPYPAVGTEACAQREGGDAAVCVLRGGAFGNNPAFVRCAVRAKQDGDEIEARHTAGTSRHLRKICSLKKISPFLLPVSQLEGILTDQSWKAIEAPVGSVGDSYDNALGETINGLYKAEVIHKRAPGKWSEVEFATSVWVDWFNNRRQLEPIGNIPLAEYEKLVLNHVLKTKMCQRHHERI